MSIEDILDDHPSLEREDIMASLSFAKSFLAAAGEKIFKFLEQVLINKTDLIMTYGQVLESSGRVKGMQEEKLGIAKGMLEDKLPKEQVSKWTGLSLSQVDKLLEEIS